jgi:hypothetical protein
MNLNIHIDKIVASKKIYGITYILKQCKNQLLKCNALTAPSTHCTLYSLHPLTAAFFLFRELRMGSGSRLCHESGIPGASKLPKTWRRTMTRNCPGELTTSQRQKRLLSFCM